MPADRPNILFINTDQQSADMLSCAGNPWLRTPALDRLAAEGVRFERAYCTNPVCLPSRFSWFTGRMPSELGIRDNKSHALETVGERVLATSAGRLLADAGYRVAYGGKTHLPADLTPEAMGCEVITADKRDELAAAGAAWIGARADEGDRPWFLSLCFVNPHDICFMGMRDHVRRTRADEPDLNVNERWLLSDESVEMGELAHAMATPEGIDEQTFFAERCPPLPSNHPPQHDEPEVVTGMVAAKAFRLHMRKTWSERDWRRHRWAYHRLTERVDAQIGTVLDALDAAGLREDTLVIFTSDHGDQAGAHQLDQKSVPYEESLRIPLLLRWPGRLPAGRVDRQHLVSNGLDLVPTLCAVAGVEAPAELIGESLLPAATDARQDAPARAIPIECELARGVICGRCKYLRYDRGQHSEQLMDLTADPGETRNHLADRALATELAACRAAFVHHFGPTEAGTGAT